MTRKIPLYLGATALLLVLGAPAFAQTAIIQNNLGGIEPSQVDTNSAVVFAPGTLVISFGSQSASSLFNAVGPTGYVGVSTPYTVDQAAGTYNSTTGVVVYTVDSTAQNFIGASNQALPALSTVAAGGNQSASNAVNLANIAPPAGSTGAITQVVGAADLTQQTECSPWSGTAPPAYWLQRC